MPSLSSFGITDMQVVWRDAGKANLVTEKKREVVIERKEKGEAVPE